uniref:ATP-dependent Clp protease proteolytic subunit n=1 Tax=Acacia exocarpoides TaxID=1708230 RepID=A0A1D0CBQ6_9FABA|nr:clpP1 [Acacia exocarpoides]
MPIGVPKVPFQGPGDEDASWDDLYNRLYRARVIFLCGRINHKLMNRTINLLTYLNMQDDNKEDITMFINSPGGWLTSGLAIYDMMRAVQPAVRTLCLGQAASTAAFILLGGAITKRLAFPNARVMMHQPAADLYQKGKTGEYFVELDEVNVMYNYVIDCYVKKTGKPKYVINEDMKKDEYITPKEAQAYGIIDEILCGRTKLI